MQIVLDLLLEPASVRGLDHSCRQVLAPLLVHGEQAGASLQAVVEPRLVQFFCEVELVDSASSFQDEMVVWAARWVCGGQVVALEIKRADLPHFAGWGQMKPGRGSLVAQQGAGGFRVLTRYGAGKFHFVDQDVMHSFDAVGQDVHELLPIVMQPGANEQLHAEEQKVGDQHHFRVWRPDLDGKFRAEGPMVDERCA